MDYFIPKTIKTNKAMSQGIANTPPLSVGDINEAIKNSGVDTNNVSDGYHTFGELYNHRIELFIALCRYIFLNNEADFNDAVWKSKKHHDGSSYDGWFIMGLNQEKGKQISYHLPISRWDECPFEELDNAPEFDGHTSADVLERLKTP